MNVQIESARRFQDARQRKIADLENAAKKGGPIGEISRAALTAYLSGSVEGLDPMPNEDGEWIYRTQQGLKAACWAREDAAATFNVQLAVLRRLEGLRWLAWTGLGLLAYIAFRMT